MFCTKCGLKNDDSSLFCAGCGTKLSKPQYAQNIPEQMPNPIVNPSASDSYDQAVSEIVNNTAYDNSDELRENVQGLMEETYQTNSEDDQTNLISSIDLSKAGQENDSETGLLNDSFDNYDTGAGFAQPQFENQFNDLQAPNGIQNDYGQQYSDQNDFSGRQPMNQNDFGGRQPMNQNDFGGQQFMNQNNFGGQPFNNQNTYNAAQANKFSFKRFFFSLLVILASVAACAAIALNYVGIKMSFMDDNETQKIKGYDLIKDGVEFDEEETMFDVDSLKDLKKTVDNFQLMLIIFEVALVVIAVIDLILLIAVRRKGAYIFTMLFSLIKMGFGGYIIYLWCFNVLDKFKTVFAQSLDSIGSYLPESIKLTFTLEIGVMLAVGLQLLIFICSIILLTCKNRQKITQ